MLTKSIVVVMGGWSPEREVSLSSGRECAKALVDGRIDFVVTQQAIYEAAASRNGGEAGSRL